MATGYMLGSYSPGKANSKFYFPNQYIEPVKKELTREERVYQDSGLAAATTAAPVAFVQGKPAPPPETFEGDYSKKTGESSSVIAMVDLLINDLDKEMTVAGTSADRKSAFWPPTGRSAGNTAAGEAKANGEKNIKYQ